MPNIPTWRQKLLLLPLFTLLLACQDKQPVDLSKTGAQERC